MKNLGSIPVSELYDELEHHGIKGQKWGIQNGPPYPLDQNESNKLSFENPAALSDHMKSFKYSEYSGLKSPEWVEKNKSGSCHDQVMYEIRELKKMGYEPKAKFLIEADKYGQGYRTHSFVYYKDESGRTTWFENAWGGQEGIRSYKNEKEMMRDVEKRMDIPKGRSLVWGTVKPENHKEGESLQEFVTKSLDDDDKK